MYACTANTTPHITIQHISTTHYTHKAQAQGTSHTQTQHKGTQTITQHTLGTRHKVHTNNTNIHTHCTRRTHTHNNVFTQGTSYTNNTCTKHMGTNIYNVYIYTYIRNSHIHIHVQGKRGTTNIFIMAGAPGILHTVDWGVERLESVVVWERVMRGGGEGREAGRTDIQAGYHRMVDSQLHHVASWNVD